MCQYLFLCGLFQASRVTVKHVVTVFQAGRVQRVKLCVLLCILAEPKESGRANETRLSGAASNELQSGSAPTSRYDPARHES